LGVIKLLRGWGFFLAKNGGDWHMGASFWDGYPSKEVDTYQQTLGAIRLLRGWGKREHPSRL
jgi:hypothetical protein